MGWFDDNHPMGSRADEEMEAAIESMGFNKWYRDPQPASGASEPARVEHPESEWDESQWRKSNLREGVRRLQCLSPTTVYLNGGDNATQDTMAKGKAKTTYLVRTVNIQPHLICGILIQNLPWLLADGQGPHPAAISERDEFARIQQHEDV
jgi:hypothetical protein